MWNEQRTLRGALIDIQRLGVRRCCARDIPESGNIGASWTREAADRSGLVFPSPPLGSTVSQLGQAGRWKPAYVGIAE